MTRRHQFAIAKAAELGRKYGDEFYRMFGVAPMRENEPDRDVWPDIWSDLQEIGADESSAEPRAEPGLIS